MAVRRDKRLFIAGLAVAGLAAWAQPATNEGTVVKIDRAALRITIKHEGIAHLDMPPMSLAFRVGNPKLLDDVAVGDKVRFAADKVGGSYMVVSLVKAR